MSGEASAAPLHAAFIMDGNGRWAERRGLPRTEGHAAGAKALSAVAKACAARGVKWVTVYAFSTENWKRPEGEVKGIFSLLLKALSGGAGDFARAGLSFRLAGRREGLPLAVRAAAEKAERLTAGNGTQLVVCLNYGGRAEIVDAARKAAAEGGEITEETFRRHLYAPDAPDPDLIVRTGGERRVSNFLLWQGAYSEFVFTDVLWPDFTEADLDAAFAEYARRTRRMGGVK